MSYEREGQAIFEVVYFFARVQLKMEQRRRRKIRKKLSEELILLLLLLATSDSSGPSGGDETDLLTGGGTSLDGRSLSDVLMVTTTVGMLDGVHGHTSDLGPAVPLHL